MSQPPVYPQRQTAEAALDALAWAAHHNEDPLLLLAVTALRNVYDLYPEADALCNRGTPEHRARVDIHNAIAAALNAWVEGPRA